MARTKKKTPGSWKTCNVCGETKRCKNFPKQKSGDGFQNICNVCRYERAKMRKETRSSSNPSLPDGLRAKANSLCSGARSRSKKKGLDFDIDIDLIEDKLRYGLCEKTGIPFRFDVNENGARSIYAATIDRIVPSLGYVDDNIQVVIMGYNGLKGEGTDMEALQVARAVVE